MESGLDSGEYSYASIDRPYSMPSGGTEAEMLAELERAKQASRAACLQEIGSHLEQFMLRQPFASYEDWIVELHPESQKGTEGLGWGVTIPIDHRYYLEDSDHRVLWNQKSGVLQMVPARNPKSGGNVEAAAFDDVASAFPPGVDISLPPLPTVQRWGNSPLEGFATMGGLPMGYRPALNRSYVPPAPDYHIQQPRSWVPPQQVRDSIPWGNAMSPLANPRNNRSYVAPIDAVANAIQQQNFQARSYVAPVDPSFVPNLTASVRGGALPSGVASSSWLPPRSVAPQVQARLPSGQPWCDRVSYASPVLDPLGASIRGLPVASVQQPRPQAYAYDAPAQTYRNQPVQAQMQPMQVPVQPFRSPMSQAQLPKAAAPMSIPAAWPVSMPTAIGARQFVNGQQSYNPQTAYGVPPSYSPQPTYGIPAAYGMHAAYGTGLRLR